MHTLNIQMPKSSIGEVQQDLDKLHARPSYTTQLCGQHPHTTLLQILKTLVKAVVPCKLTTYAKTNRFQQNLRKDPEIVSEQQVDFQSVYI